MIENPKVGQRVFFLTHQNTTIPVTISGYSTIPGKMLVKTDESPVSDYVSDESLYDSPQSATTALRSQAAELIAAAEKLEQEEHNEPARPGGSLTAPHDKPPKTREPGE